MARLTHEALSLGTMRPMAAADFLGISERHMSRLLKDGEIPFQEIGRMKLVPRFALEEWIARGGGPEDEAFSSWELSALRRAA